jgi:predicted MFS family arabinose efflux permease
MKSTNTWTKAAIPAVLLVLHNANRLAPVPLFEELRVHFGTDYVGVGNIFGAYLLTYALFNIPAGMLADKMNNKSLITMGVALSLLASAVFAFARSYSAAAFSRMALGIAGALIYVPTVRYVVISFPQEKRGAVMGFVEVGAGIGMIMSLSLLPLFAKEFDLTKAFLMLPVLSALVLGAMLLGLPSEQTHGVPSARSSLLALAGNRCFWFLVIYFFLDMLAHYSVMGWLPTFLRIDFGYSSVKAGLTSTLVTIALVVGSPFAGILSDRLCGRTPVLLSGSIMSAVGLTLFLFSRDPKIIVGSAFLYGLSMAFTIPVLIILVGETFGATGAGVAVSIAAMTGQIASSFSGMLFGFVFQKTNTFDAVWGLSLMIAAGSIPFLLDATKLIKKMKGMEHEG